MVEMSMGTARSPSTVRAGGAKWKLVAMAGGAQSQLRRTRLASSRATWAFSGAWQVVFIAYFLTAWIADSG